MKTKSNNYRVKLIFLYLLQLIVLIAPISIVILINFDDYVSSPQKTFSLSFGLVTALTVVALQILGKLPKNVHGVIKLGLVTVFLWMLRPILDELCILLTCAFVGELLSFVCFAKAVKNLRQKADYKQSIIVKKAVETDETDGRV